MERHFIQQMEKLKMTLLNMAALTQKAIHNAAKAFLERDEELARSVIGGDKDINELELAIDGIILKLLALEQPMAKDLRFILCATKISNELERIADKAVNIAERTLLLCESPPLDQPIPAMEKLIDTVEEMLEKAISSLVEENTKKAIAIRKMDDLADYYTLEVLQTMIARQVKSAISEEYDTRMLIFSHSISIIAISKCFERIGDKAINIGEQVTFFVDGVNIKHKYVQIEEE